MASPLSEIEPTTDPQSSTAPQTRECNFLSAHIGCNCCNSAIACLIELRSQRQADHLMAKEIGFERCTTRCAQSTISMRIDLHNTGCSNKRMTSLNASQLPSTLCRHRRTATNRLAHRVHLPSTEPCTSQTIHGTLLHYPTHKSCPSWPLRQPVRSPTGRPTAIQKGYSCQAPRNPCPKECWSQHPRQMKRSPLCPTSCKSGQKARCSRASDGTVKESRLKVPFHGMVL